MSCFLECIFWVSELNLMQPVDLFQSHAEGAANKKKSINEEL